MSPDREPTGGPVVVRWSSTDKRGNARGGGVEYAELPELVGKRFNAGDRWLVAMLDGREVAWIGVVDGRRVNSYETERRVARDAG